jgi:hypothetical protein
LHPIRVTRAARCHSRGGYVDTLFPYKEILIAWTEQEETFVEGVVNNEKMSRISRIYSEVIKYLPPEDGYAFSEDLNVTRYLFYRYQYALTEQDLSAQLEASLSASTAGLDDSGSFEASSSSPKKPKRSRSLQNLTPEAGKEPQVNLRGSESVEFVVSPTSREAQKLYQSVLVNNHNKVSDLFHDTCHS